MWNDPEPLLRVLDSQFKLLFDATDPRQLLLLPKLLSMLEREPVLSSVLTDLRQEAEVSLENFRECSGQIRRALRQLWALHGRELAAHLATCEDREHIDAFWELDNYEEGLEADDDVTFPEDGPIQEEIPGDKTGNLLRALQHWVRWCRQTKCKAAWLKDAADMLDARMQEQERAYRLLRLATESLGWCAFIRLQALTVRLNPEANDIVRIYAYNDFRDVAFGSKSITGTRDTTGGRRIRSALALLASDARLLHEELRTRLLRGLSRRSVLSRYAARCEAFRAKELRKLAKPRRREGPLTLDLAAYLFDCGFAPIIDPNIGQLRPDVIAVSKSSLFYVEAKQYDRSPRRQLELAYMQVWSTWMRLEKHYSLVEGFLVVFRRGGELVDLPPELDFGGRRLYSILVDISPSGGSRERSTPVGLDPARLVPAPSRSRTRGAAPQTRGAPRTRRTPRNGHSS